MRCIFPALLFLSLPALAGELPFAVKGPCVEFDPQSRSARITDDGAGQLLDTIVVSASCGGRQVSSDDKALAFTTRGDGKSGEFAVAFKDAFTLTFALKGPDVTITVDGALDGPAALRARSSLAPGALPALLQSHAGNDMAVLVTRLGTATIPGAPSLYDPLRDLALTATPPERVRWVHTGSGAGVPAGGWELRATGSAGQPLVSLHAQGNYYRAVLGLEFFVPMFKQRRWPTAPVVAMTWYGIEAMNGRPAQTKERLVPQIDWVAEHLRPYAGGNMVFQLDDNYAYDDDALMRELSDYIRSKGLVPGIWFTPFTVMPKRDAEVHPEWFLHDKDNNLIATFGGVNWGGNFTLNANNRQALERCYLTWWGKVGSTWKFDFFKIDGQPEVIAAYRKAADGGGLVAYRRALAVGHGTVGEDRFVNACWGTPVEAIGPVNGSRTGGDTGYDPHAINVVLEWNFLNNVAWWCDPDAAACLYKATVERARLNAQARVLTGQQFLTDDLWTKVPPEIRRVWQLAFPSLDIYPVNLYPIKEWRKYDVFDLRIAKPWGTWDVVGVFNYDGRPTAKTLDLERLPLDAPEVYVFDYWRSACVGRCRRHEKIPLWLAPYEGKLFALAPVVGDRPVLVSTSRHLSQGGLDLERLDWKQDGERWTAAGSSSHLVKGDAYELCFAAGRYGVSAAKSSCGEAQVSRARGAVRVALTPPESGAADWEVSFEPLKEPALDVLPDALDLPAGATGRIVVRNLGPAPARLVIEASDKRIRLNDPPAEIGPWPAEAAFMASADVADLELGSALNATVSVGVHGAKALPQKVEVRARAPLPENLAAKAKAQASSVWGAGFEAAKVNDSDAATRWNSKKGDVNGCWVELAWDAPVRFDRVVLDECTDWGQRVQQWKLLAGGDELKEIANGTQVGRQFTVNLPEGVEARRLRLLIEKASDTPTFWEIEVQRIKR